MSKRQTPMVGAEPDSELSVHTLGIYEESFISSGLPRDPAFSLRSWSLSPALVVKEIQHCHLLPKGVLRKIKKNGTGLEKKKKKKISTLTPDCPHFPSPQEFLEFLLAGVNAAA